MKIISQRVQVVLVAVVMSAGLIALYSAGFGHQLIFDDIRAYNDAISGASSISFRFRGLWVASYQFIHDVFGVELYWQRIFNVVLHIVNAFLLWILTSMLIKRALREECSDATDQTPVSNSNDPFTLVGVAVPVAVIAWAFNPVAVYAVQYLTQRSTLMATAFTVAALITFIAALDAKSPVRRFVWMTGTFVFYLFAVWSKEHAAPGVALLLPLYIYWRRPSFKKFLAGGLVLLALTAAAAVVMVSRKGWVIGAATEDMVRPFLLQLDALRPGASEQVYFLSLINQAWLFFRYGLLWIVPWVGWMSIDMRPPFPLTWYALPYVLGGVALIVIVMVGVWALLVRRGRASLLGLLALIPAILFSTELAFVRLQEPFVLYRSYLWSIAIPPLLAVVITFLFIGRQWVVATGLLLAVGFGFLSFDRIASLRDERHAWGDALEKIDLNGPPNMFGRWRAPLNLSKDAVVRGGDLGSAYRWAELADRLGAPGGSAKFNMGTVLLSLKRPDAALKYFSLARSEGFDGAPLYYSLGTAYQMQGRASDAFSFYDQALASKDLKDGYKIQILIQAGRFANDVGDFHSALKYFSMLRQMRPDDVSAILGESYANMRLKNFDAALRLLTSEIDKSQSPQYYHARAVVHLNSGNFLGAENDIDAALARDPDNPVFNALKNQLLEQMSRARSK
ncbi:MAG: hypothetical protein AB1371_06450 [Pseudomonadota bacterium]